MNDAHPVPRGLLLALLCAPLPAMASDPAGLLTIFVGLPVLAVAVVVLGLLVIFRRHAWVRAIGLLIGVPVLLAGVYVGYVDTWRFWPEPDGADAPVQISIVLGYGVLWLCAGLFTGLLWRSTVHRAASADIKPMRYP